jgi:Tol biopolymer transport system component
VLGLGVAFLIAIGTARASTGPSSSVPETTGGASGSSSTCASPPTPPTTGLGQIAYLRGRDLRVVDLSDGADRTLVADALRPHHGFGNPIMVRWSRDGRWIAFGAGKVVPSGGGATCRPLGRSIGSWSWSPSSDELVGVTRSGGLIIGGPERAPFPLLPSGWGAISEFGPAYDPTGRYVAVGRVRTGTSSIPAEGSLWVVDLSTGLVRELIDERGALPIVAGWSPDGSWILWWNGTQFSGSVAADGLALRATSADGSTTRTIATPVLVHPDFLSWCGDRLVVAAGGFRDVRSGKRLAIASAPSWHASPLLRDPSRDWIWPSCSPDGRWAAATAGHPPPPQALFGRERRTIWLVATDGSANQQLVGPSSAPANDLPRWSRDGRSILFIRRTLNAKPSASLFLASVDPTSGALLGVTGPIADLGPVGRYDAGYGYYLWSYGTDWFQPSS